MKYNKGDKIEIELTEKTARLLNAGDIIGISSEQITKHTPAPFDWSTVKPGMAFKHYISEEKTAYTNCKFIGFTSSDLPVFEYIVTNQNGEDVTFTKICNKEEVEPHNKAC